MYLCRRVSIQVLGQGAEGVVRVGTYGGNEVAVKVCTLSMMTSVSMVELLTEAQAEAKMLVSRFESIVSMLVSRLQERSQCTTGEQAVSVLLVRRLRVQQ
jgi:hypothetical protein